MEGRQLNLARDHHREQSQCARRALDDKKFTTLVRTQAIVWFIRHHKMPRPSVRYYIESF